MPLLSRNVLELEGIRNVIISNMTVIHSSGTKKEHKPKLLSPDVFGGVRVFHVNGVGAKKFGMSLETRETKLFWRDIPGLCRDIPEVPEKFEKKRFVFNFRSLFCKNFGRKLVSVGMWLSVSFDLVARSVAHPVACSPMRRPAWRRKDMIIKMAKNELIGEALISGSQKAPAERAASKIV